MFKTIHDFIEFLYEKCKLTSLEFFRALWNQSTWLSFVEKGPFRYNKLMYSYYCVYKLGILSIHLRIIIIIIIIYN